MSGYLTDASHRLLLTMSKAKFYVGCKAGERHVFKSDTEPTTETHGHLYNACIGPFRTKRGAEFMQKHGKGNPHCQTVAQAERLAIRHRLRTLLNNVPKE